MADEADDGLVGVVGVDPLKAGTLKGALPQGGLLVVDGVERGDERLLPAVGLELLREEVLDALVVAPLDELANLVAHEVELAAGVRHLVERQGAQARELAPGVSRHARDQRALAVDHLVVAKRQHEVLVELVHGGEGQHAVVARAPREVGLHVVQGVVHPAHVPLEVEAQAAVLGRVGHQRPGRGLLGDHHDVGVEPTHLQVGLADEGGRVQVLLGAILVEALLTRVVDAEVHVQHGADAVHADAVDVVGLNPVQGVGDQEAAHFSPAEVELVGAPVGVDLVLVEHLAVEGGQAVGVRAEAAGHPVHDHADAGLVAGVDEVHELLRVAVARRGREVPGGLVAPGAVKRVLGEGQDLDVGVAHLADVVHELDGEVVVGVEGAALRGEGVAGTGPGAVLAGLALRLVAVALPAAQVHLKDVERALKHVALGAGAHPGGVCPLVAGEVRRAGGSSRRQLREERVGVRLVEALARGGLYDVLVELTCGDAGNEALPDAAGGGAGEAIGVLVPVVELADDGDGAHVGGPDGKVVAVLAEGVRGGVAAELLVAAVPFACAEEVQVVVAQVERAVRDGGHSYPSARPPRRRDSE